MRIIKINSEEDKIYCQCGKRMKPRVFLNIIQYSCPKCKIWNFWKHSLPQVFDRIYENN